MISIESFTRMFRFLRSSRLRRSLIIFDALFKGQVVCVELIKSVFNKFSEDFDLRDKIFKHLRTIKGVEVIVILTEQKKNLTRVNLRSQSRVNVARLASLFGGGGHRRASGCFIEGSIQEARKKVMKAIEGFIIMQNCKSTKQLRRYCCRQ